MELTENINHEERNERKEFIIVVRFLDYPFIYSIDRKTGTKEPSNLIKLTFVEHLLWIELCSSKIPTLKL